MTTFTKRRKRGLTGLIAIGLGAALVPTLAGGVASAAPGDQLDPVLSPAVVDTFTTPFSFTFASAADNPHCDGTGAQNWRAHAFIVSADVDIPSLQFGPTPSGWAGIDFDGSDGTIAAPLFVGSDPRVAMLPANTPAGLIDPAQLQGFNFDPSFGWAFVDGEYQIGFICEDGTGFAQQWWILDVTIDADASPNPFMQVGVAPSAPTLDAVEAGDGELEVTFTPDGDATEYEVTAAPVGGGSSVTESGSGSPITLTGLTNGTAYDVSVAATNAIGTSAASNVITATPGDFVAPAAPTVAIDDPIGEGNVTSVGVSGTGEDGTTANISVDDTDAVTPAVTTTAPVTGGSYDATLDLSGLADGTITATVTLTDAASNVSDPGTDTATKDTVPDAPSVTITDPITAANQASVSVSGAGDAGMASISVDDNDPATPAVTTTVPVTGGTYAATLDLTSLSDGPITATVTVTNTLGNTGPAGTDTATKNTAPPPPPADNPVDTLIEAIVEIVQEVVKAVNNLLRGLRL